MKRFLIIFASILFLSTGIAFAENTNTGIIPGQIWYSKQPLIEGETVSIHTVVWNGENSSLYTTIEFYDKNIILGTRDVIIPKESSRDISVSWKVTAGDHVISAAITSSKITIADGSQKLITLDSRVTQEDKQFVSKVIANINEKPAIVDAIAKDKINETVLKITDAIPASVSVPVKETFSNVEDFRNETYSTIKESKIKTQEKLDELNGINSTDNKTVEKKSTTTTSPKNKTEAVKKVSTGIDGTEKPIAYVKFFLLSIAGFIFGSKIIFYLVGAFLIFIILRFFWRKIKKR
jgi:hypothetical protein